MAQPLHMAPMLAGKVKHQGSCLAWLVKNIQPACSISRPLMTWPPWISANGLPPACGHPSPSAETLACLLHYHQYMRGEISINSSFYVLEQTECRETPLQAGDSAKRWCVYRRFLKTERDKGFIRWHLLPKEIGHLCNWTWCSVRDSQNTGADRRYYDD